MRFTAIAIAEGVVVGPDGLRRVDNILRGHFGPKELPWTTTLALLLAIKGHEAERFEITAEIIEEGAVGPLWFRVFPVELSNDTEQEAILRVGPVAFERPGRFIFRAATPVDSIQTIADLTSASGQ